MVITSSYLKIIIVIILCIIIIGFVFAAIYLSSKPHSQLIISDTKLSVMSEKGNQFLFVDANITNIGKSDLSNIYLLIQTYFSNGTESSSYKMILWKNATVSNFESGFRGENVTIKSGESYLVQDGNYEFVNDPEIGRVDIGFPLIPYELQYTEFFAHYKITAFYQTT